MYRDRHLQFWLSFPVVASLMVFGLIPLLFPLSAKYEGKFLPVVENVEIISKEITEEGILVEILFDKTRSCKFLGISWYDELGHRIVVEFDPKGETNIMSSPTSRPAIPGQVAGPWLLRELTNLENSSAIVSHKCHPMWITFTPFYS